MLTIEVFRKYHTFNLFMKQFIIAIQWFFCV